MIVREFYRTRNDGVKLFRTIDAKVGDDNKPLRDENGELIPTGYYIIQNETGVMYSEAIDVEDAPYTYSESDEEIVDSETVEDEEGFEIVSLPNNNVVV